MTIKIINNSSFELPNYETEASAGMDLRANNSETITLKPMERKLVKTGLFMELPKGYEGQVRPRSGLALKKLPKCKKWCFPNIQRWRGHQCATAPG